MLRRSLACLVLLVACGPAAPRPADPQPAAPHAPAAPAAAAPAAPAGAPAADEVSRWIAKLDDPRESERAVLRLEAIGDPRAIPGLGEAWNAQGRPPRMLQAIIGLARPLTPHEAAAAALPAYAQAGRPAHWDEALPFLNRAIAEADEANPRSLDSAHRAADAIGDARLTAGAPALIGLAQRPPTRNLIMAQIAAIRALGSLADDKARAAAALVQIVEREPPPIPSAKDGAERRQRAERFELTLTVTGASINALAELRADATRSLLLAMYQLPQLLTQIRRALVASGPGAAGELRKILRGEHAAVNQLFRARQLDRSCGDGGGGACRPVSARDYYAAAALGGFHDATAAPDLLAALKRPAAPAYFVDDEPGPSQHIAILEALRDSSSPDAAAALRALWADRKAELATRVHAIETYPFVTRDGAAADELGRIAADNKAEDELRQAAATAFAQLARDPRAIALLQSLAKRYVDASADKRKEADRARPRADAADQELASARQAFEAKKAALLALVKDSQSTADQIRAETATVKQAEQDYKAAVRAHREKVRSFKEPDAAARAYLGYARMFQTHIARVEIAIRCKEDLRCFAASLSLTTDEAARNLSPYVKDVFGWTTEQERDLIAAAVERAMLELGKRGAKAEGVTTTLLDRVASEHRPIWQSILRALPRIAKLPCAECVEKLDAAVKAAEGKAALADFAREAALLRGYFAWAGAR
jgi:hypothetical protein